MLCLKQGFVHCGHGCPERVDSGWISSSYGCYTASAAASRTAAADTIPRTGTTSAVVQMTMLREHSLDPQPRRFGSARSVWKRYFVCNAVKILHRDNNTTCSRINTVTAIAPTSQVTTKRRNTHKSNN